MREKEDRIAMTSTPALGDRARIQNDLERIGVSPQFSAPVASRLAVIAGDLSGDEYRAVLEGVATAYGVHCDGRQRSVRGALEMQRLLEDFAIELKKLDEGLKTLSSYLLRMKHRSAEEPGGLLH
jgi:hypothetical protein